MLSRPTFAYSSCPPEDGPEAVTNIGELPLPVGLPIAKRRAVLVVDFPLEGMLPITSFSSAL
jgi:hypothetical protein